MIRFLRSLSVLLSLAVGLVCIAYSADHQPPTIVAQGFDMSVTQEGQLDEFGQVRVRFEVPDRIAELYIKERSYEVDLAKTADASHFSLFGISTQVRQLTDVTLDFQNYINRKFEAEGVYTINLRVTDRNGRSVSEDLMIRTFTTPPAAVAPSLDAVSSGEFRFERVGSAAVSGADRFGISWKTIDSGDVLVELHPAEGSSSSFVKAVPVDYDEVITRTQLEQAASGAETVESLLLPVAGNKAAGSVFGVIGLGQPYLLRVTGSETSVSPDGTRVIMVGEYKH